MKTQWISFIIDVAIWVVCHTKSSNILGILPCANYHYVKVPSCNETETRVSILINNTFGRNELPSDLLLLADKLNKSNTTVLLQNCSHLLTLKQYLYEHATQPMKDDIPKVYYTALYAYVEMTYQMTRHTYTPKTNADIILLTNAFASTSLNPVLERKMHLFFFYYGNWLEKLKERNFPFENYHDPRSLLLDMICELINDPLYRVYEREIIFFLILNKHTCSFIEYYYRHTKPIDHFHNGPYFEYTSIRPLMEYIDSRNMTKSTVNNWEENNKVNKSNGSRNMLLFQNVSIKMLNNKVLPKASFVGTTNESRLYLNFSIINSVNLKQTNKSHPNHHLLPTFSEHQPTTSDFFLAPLNSSTTTTTNDPETNIQDRRTTQLVNISVPIQAEMSHDNIVPTLFTQEISTSRYLLDTLRQNHSNFSHIYTTPSAVKHNYHIEEQHTHNFTVWDIVEMDGPCKEGQQHVVKLNVQSLLTAIDEHVANSSLELFRKLLNQVKAFPIEDYNARGELLRDLIPVTAKEQTDPLVKKSIEDILDHVILDGPGALPPKIKLECVDYPQENLKRTARRTRRVFNIEFE